MNHNRIISHSVKRVCFILLVIIFNVSNNNQKIYADTEASSSIKVTLEDSPYLSTDGSIEFSPILNDTNNFFVNIKNIGDKPVSVSIFPSNPTMGNGTINYLRGSGGLLNKDYDLKKYVELIFNGAPFKSTTIKLEANQTKIIEIRIRINKTLKGEILGGINFEQVIGASEQKEKFKVIQLYQKVIVTRLSLDKFELKKEQTVKNISFYYGQNNLNLNFELSNNNPILSYINYNKYQLFNPKGNIIAQGVINDKKILLPPFTKNKINISLPKKVLLSKGKYKIILTGQNSQSINKFIYNPTNTQKPLNNHILKKNSAKYASSLITYLIFAAIVITIPLNIIIHKKYKHK